MKKTIAVFLIFALALSLAACAKHNSNSDSNANSEYGKGNNTTADETGNIGSSQSLSSGEWIGIGGSYALESIETPENTLTATICHNEVYYLTDEFSENYMGYSLWRGIEKVYDTTDIVTGGAPSEEGIWLRNYASIDGEYKYVLSLISPTGENLRTIDLTSVYSAETYGSVCWASGRLYITCDDAVMLIMSDDGELICTIDLPGSSLYPVAAENGQVYAVSGTSQGNDLYLISQDSESLSLAFSCGSGTVYDGGAGNFMLLGNSYGLYTLTADGMQNPIAIWDECYLSINGLSGVLPLNDGRYMLQYSSGLSILAPVDSTDIHAKIRLTLADIHGGAGLERDIATFNSTSQDYYIEVVDYSDHDAFDEGTALTRMNTEIMSGKYPDMVSFRFISPLIYISKGLLTDMTQYLGRDPDISLDDVAISRALPVSGGIYFIGSSFTIQSIVARYSDFGDRNGWTVAEYLDIDSSRPMGADTLYNLTRESFIENIVPRYFSTAIDWDNGTSHFDSPEFTEILEAALRIKETPEDPNDMDYTPGVVKVANGTLVGAASFIDNVSELSQAEAQAGCRLSVIGWPTPDGSCGSQIALRNSVGIISQSANQEGCWEFIKFMLMNADVNDAFSLPAYLPALNTKIESAKVDEGAQIRLTDEDGKRLLNIISAIENTTVYDNTIMNIVREETTAMFAGAQTAAETAKMIQSRVSIYVAEQYG